MSFKLYRMVFGCVALISLWSAGTVIALEIPDNTTFLKTELAITGISPSSLWHGRMGVSGLNVASDESQDGTYAADSGNDDYEGGANKSNKVKAGFYSLILPGAGQYYNGQKKKAYIMAGAEVAIWTAYFVFDTQGDNRMDSAEDYAGIYAGTNGEHATNYWQSVGRYMDNDAYNDSVLREARALQETPSGLIYGDDSWQWVNDTRRTDFNKLRADGNTSYKRRDFMILFAVINRAVSVVDAVIGAGNNPGSVEAEVLGMNMKVEVLPSWTNPGAQCVISRSF